MLDYQRHATDRDTLRIGFAGRRTTGPVAADGKWDLNLLLRRHGAADLDSIVTVAVDSVGSGVAAVAPWSQFDEVLALATNGNGDFAGQAVIAIDTAAPPSPRIPRTVEVFPNPLSLRAVGAGVTIAAPALQQVRIYSVAGVLLWQRHVSAPTTSVSWDLTAGGARHVAPGTYFAAIDYRSAASSQRELERRRILVTP